MPAKKNETQPTGPKATGQRTPGHRSNGLDYMPKAAYACCMWESKKAFHLHLLREEASSDDRVEVSRLLCRRNAPNLAPLSSPRLSRKPFLQMIMVWNDLEFSSSSVFAPASL